MKQAKLLVIGLGLIGSSVALAAKQRQLFRSVMGYARKASTLDYCLEKRLIDRPENNLQQALAVLEPGDLVMLAVPVLAAKTILQQCVGLQEQVTLTDVLSTKRQFIDSAKDCWNRIPPNLVPAHPIAGSEKSGAQYADADLFVNRHTIITPCSESEASQVQRVAELWHQLGARVEFMQPDQHDEVFSAVSHLPHILSYSLINMLASLEYPVCHHGGTGFNDVTRLAASDPEVWHDICLANAEPLLRHIDLYQQELGELRQLISNRDSEAIKQRLSRAQRLKRQI